MSRNRRAARGRLGSCVILTRSGRCAAPDRPTTMTTALRTTFGPSTGGTGHDSLASASARREDVGSVLIDTSFDVRTDARGRDPDLTSPTLRRYHRLLWSKPLPCGMPFTLDTVTPRRYLHHHSELGEFSLASD